MTLQGKYFYPIRAMAQGKASYNASVVTRNVGYLDALSKMPWDGFIAGTKDVKSGAMPAVFAETAKFKESQDRFQVEFTKLSDLVKKGGDEPSIKAADPGRRQELQRVSRQFPGEAVAAGVQAARRVQSRFGLLHAGVRSRDERHEVE